MNRPMGYRHSEETRRKISESHKKIDHYWIANINKGKKFSEEWKEKLRLVKLGKPRTGNPERWKHTDDTKKIISEKNKGHIPWNKGMKGVLVAWNKGKGKYPGGRDPQKIKARIKKYRELGLSALYLRNTRAKRKLAEGKITSDEWNNLKKQYNFNCPSCFRIEPEIKLSIDHIVPLSKGGSNWIDNIQPLCVKCNVKKHTKEIKYEQKRRTV